MKVEVKPLLTKKWHGKQGKESFSRPIKIHALIDSENMEYSTGLSPEEAKEYGELLKQDLSPQYDPDTPHSFWDSNLAVVKLENNTMFFDVTKPLDFIKMRILKASKFVANSLKEYEDGLFPEATHYIHDEHEEIELKATKVAIKNKVVIECAKLSKDRKVQIVMILSGKNYKGKSDDFVEVELDKIIEKKPNDVLRYIQMDKEDVVLHSLILEALQKNVLRKQGHKIFYHDSVIGNDIYDVISYLKDVENQDLRLRLMSAVN